MPRRVLEPGSATRRVEQLKLGIEVVELFHGQQLFKEFPTNMSMMLIVFDLWYVLEVIVILYNYIYILYAM